MRGGTCRRRGRRGCAFTAPAGFPGLNLNLNTISVDRSLFGICTQFRHSRLKSGGFFDPIKIYGPFGRAGFHSLGFDSHHQGIYQKRTIGLTPFSLQITYFFTQRDNARQRFHCKTKLVPNVRGLFLESFGLAASCFPRGAGSNCGCGCR